MSELSPEQLSSIAWQHLEAGRVAAAGDLCRQILSRWPQNHDAKGIQTCNQVYLRRTQEGPGNTEFTLLRTQISTLCKTYPARAVVHELDSWVCFELENYHECVEAARRATALGRSTWEGSMTLGRALRKLNRDTEAANAFVIAAGIRADDPETKLELTAARFASGAFDEAALNMATAPSASMGRMPLPQMALLMVEVGDGLLEWGYPEEAVKIYRRALAVDPLDITVRKRVGDVVWGDDLIWAAVAQMARTLKPGHAVAAFELANALHEARMKDEAAVAYREAIAIEPGYVAAINNLGMTLLDQGEVKGAMAQFRGAMAMTKTEGAELAMSHSNLLYAMHFDPETTADKLVAEHAAWAEKFADPLRGEARAHENDRSPGRRLRVGYVSGNFANHPVGRFIVPVLEAHTDAVEVFCYATSKRDDELTQRAKAAADVWVVADAMKDAVLAEKVRRDHIDILVDLTMHMSGCRLGVFARRPAPVQMSYLAYNSTTGVDAIGWRITDRWVEGDGGKALRHKGTEAPWGFVEKPAVLEGCYWCYDVTFAEAHSPAVNKLPAKRCGHVTFGCMNNFAKVSQRALEVWGRLLREVDGAQLILHAQPGAHREKIWERFAAAGVARERVRFFDWLSVDQFYTLHHAIDIALDPFPTVGGTTTCDALWMGVPVVSLVGSLPIGRSGRSILQQVGLGELAVNSEEQYMEAAAALAGDWGRLGKLRGELRGRVLEGLGNGAKFVADLEGVYRRVWREWCGE